MQIALLGPLRVATDDGVHRELPGPRVRRLLIALALRPREVATPAYLAEAVWGGDPPADPANALQALVSRLRRAVPGIPVATRPAGYVLDVPDDAIDARRFDQLVATADRDDPYATAKQLGAALQMWHGPALADVAGEPFAEPSIARLDEARLVALHDRIDARLRSGPPGPLIPELEGLVAAYPLREPLIALLMRAHAAAGDRGRALGAYTDARRRLADELGIDPSPELAAIHVRILRDERPRQPAEIQTSPGSPPPAAEPAARTNLRAELTSFIGRDRDSAELRALIGSARLATVLGAGGSGKTRLAAHVARGLLESDMFPDGAWMVEFAPVSEPADLAATVADKLEVRDGPLVVRQPGAVAAASEAGILDRVIATLSGKTALLVFDNCEHLIGPIAALAERICGSCPSVRVLATSREPLGLIGEALWPIEPLALPPEDASESELMRYDAVRLLAERAAAVRPGFAVTGANAAAVVRICRALDGMPLAIELAAARLRIMSPGVLADRLSDRFAVLTGGSRTALPRHQTLRAMVDWSFELTSASERRLWRRLSVCYGGATLDAVENICGGDFDTLTALADKSLVIVRDEQPGPRFHMLETIKAYGRMKLDESGERDAVLAAHADYFRRLATDAREHLHGPDQLEWFAALQADHDNLNAAVRYAIAAGDGPAALEMAGALGWYWWVRGHRREGADLVADALAIGGSEDSEARAVGYTVGALLAVDGSNDLDLAMSWFTAAHEMVTRLHGAADPLLRLVPPMRMLFQVLQSPASVVPTDVELPVDDPYPWVAATALTMRAHTVLNFGRASEEAVADFQAALRIFRRLGERWGMSFSLSSLATVSAWRGDLDEAVAYLEEALTAVTELGVWEDRITVRMQLVRLLWLRGDRDRARDELAAGERDAARYGAPDTRALSAHTAADLARLGGDPAAARRLIDRASALMSGRVFAPQFRAMIAGTYGYVAAAEGDRDGALARHRKAVEIAVSSVDAPVIAQAMVGLADIALLDDDAHRAASLLGAGVAVRGRPDWSLPDAVRVDAQARAALGAAGFDEAYERGRALDLTAISELTGVQMPHQFASRLAGSAAADARPNGQGREDHRQAGRPQQ